MIEYKYEPAVAPLNLIAELTEVIAQQQLRIVTAAKSSQ